MENCVSVTVVSTIDGPCDYTPRTAVFSNRDAAENYKNSLEALFEKYDQSYNFHVSIDSGVVDSESYLDIFEMDLQNDLDVIVHVKDHYEVYCNGEFFCSADTIHEAKKEIDKGDHIL